MTWTPKARPTISRRGVLRGGAALALMSAGAASVQLDTAAAAQRRLDYTFFAQEKSYSCSAATTRLALNVHKILPAESELRDALHLNGGGLDSIDYLVDALNTYTGTTYHRLRQWSGSDYAAKLDADVRASIDAGYAVAQNVWFLNVGHNVPKRTSSGHYLTIMGYDEQRYYIADPASAKNGPGFWAPKTTVVGRRKDNRYVAAVNATTKPKVWAGTGWPVLSVDSTGHHVTALQHLLAHRGQRVDVDGHFGPATKSAVTAFQTSAGLAADGFVGRLTWGKMVATVASGASGEHVKAVQVSLAAVAADVAVDGRFGAASLAATKAFQRARGLVADGVVGANTWAALV